MASDELVEAIARRLHLVMERVDPFPDDVEWEALDEHERQFLLAVAERLFPGQERMVGYLVDQCDLLHSTAKYLAEALLLQALSDPAGNA